MAKTVSKDSLRANFTDNLEQGCLGALENINFGSARSYFHINESRGVIGEWQIIIRRESIEASNIYIVSAFDQNVVDGIREWLIAVKVIISPPAASMISHGFITVLSSYIMRVNVAFRQRAFYCKRSVICVHVSYHKHRTAILFSVFI